MSRIAILVFVFSVLISCKTDQKSIATEFQIEDEQFTFENNSYESENGKFQLLMSDKGDLNNDGIDDMVSLIQLQSGGSGTFYYLNVHISDEKQHFTFLDQKFIGDRIKPDFLTIYKGGSFSNVTGIAIHPDDYGKIAFGYYTYGKDQPFSEEPKIYVTPKWKITDGQLESVALF